MGRAKIMTAEEAVAMIKDGETVGVGGFVGTSVPEELQVAIEKRYLETSSPKNLTLVYAAGQGDGKDRGANHFGHEGLIKRVVGGHWNLAPKLQKLAIDNKIEAYNLPQGVISRLYREIAAGNPGVITHVGLKTFVDPDLMGGKLNSMTKEDIVEKITLNNKDYMFYKSFPINVAFIRGTYADEDGNITLDKEPLKLEALPLAMACKNSGGKVFVQVEKVVRRGTFDPKSVKIPSILVDGIIVTKGHPQTYGTHFEESYISACILPVNMFEKYPLNARKIVARRSAMFLNKSDVVNYGIGIPEVIAEILKEEGLIGETVATVEAGAIGGNPAGGLDFGCAVAPEAILDQAYQFDFYDGGGLDKTFLGLAQCDKYGNINVSKFGPRIAGCGGFIDISQNSKQVIFCGTFTAGGLKVKCEDKKLVIAKEGESKKFIQDVEQITFSGEFAKENGKTIYYITERAVFILDKNGFRLTEVAPGIDIEKDILAHMEFRPEIDENLKLMDERIFSDKPMGLTIS